MTNNKSGQVVWSGFDENRKGRKSERFKIIDDFASIKARKVLYQLSFLSNLTEKVWIQLCSDGVVCFQTQVMHDLH